MIEIVEYDPLWPALFDELSASIWPVVSSIARSIEHVGSTSIPGLAAKPIIDIDIVVHAADVKMAIQLLGTLGYEHIGDLGLPGREAFRHNHRVPHHLYVCDESSMQIRYHLAFRDHLRSHSDLTNEYAILKKELAAHFPFDIDAYCAGKSSFIGRVLESAGFSEAEITALKAANAVR